MGTWRILFRHMLPNIIAPILVLITLDFGAILLVEAGLSFLGLGAIPPVPEWGAKDRFAAEMAGIRSDIKGIDEKFSAEMDGLKSDFKRVENTLTSELRRVEEKFSAEMAGMMSDFKRVEDTLSSKIESFEKSLDPVRHVAVLEAKVRELEAKTPKEQP